jgi:hypothetical protein
MSATFWTDMLYGKKQCQLNLGAAKMFDPSIVLRSNGRSALRKAFRSKCSDVTSPATSGKVDDLSETKT